MKAIKNVYKLIIGFAFLVSLVLTGISYTPGRYAIVCAVSLILIVKELKHDQKQS